MDSLASAYLITKNQKYVKQALKHLKAWFVNDSTRMNPTLLYAQKVKPLGVELALLT